MENNGINSENMSSDAQENNNNVRIAVPNAMTLLPECDPTLPEIKRETEDNEVEVVNNSGINTKNVWLPNSDNPSEWKGNDILSKSII